uniref:Timeless N-terminal domain-containing protein n=1 Tax=Trichuris muris TaxID=70415 RepID=A0A5S6QRS4_TRIMR
MEQVNKDLQAAVGSLGFLDGQTYMKEPDCHETLKDIIYFLRHDDVDHTARKFIGACNIVGNDLVPIVVSYPDDVDLFDSAMKLLVNLTQPVDILMEHTDRRVISTNAETATLLSCLQQSQSAFANEQFFAVLTAKLKPLVAMKWHERREEHVVLMQRILALSKQVLSIPPATVCHLLVSSSSTADRIIVAMEMSKFLDVLLDIAKSRSNRDFHFTCLEIVRALVNSQKADVLARSSVEQEQKWQEERRLLLKDKLENDMREMEMERRKIAARTQRFPSIYAIRGKKAIGGVNDAISLKPKATVGQLSQDHLKKPKKFGKKQAGATTEAPRLSPLSVRLALRNFCSSLLRSGFSRLIATCYQMIARGESRNRWATECYMWAAAFFLKFSRYYSLRQCNLSIFTSVGAVHFVQQELQSCVELTASDKENASQWGRRAQMSLQAYCEQLKALWFISQGSDPDASAAASETLGVIFRVVEYRELLITLLKNYNPAHLSKSYLKDLIEGTHFYLEILEFFCKLHGGSMIVQRKVRQHHRRRKPRNTNGPLPEDIPTPGAADAPRSRDDQWPILEEELKQALSDPSSLPDNVVPVDFAADYQHGEETAAKVKIQETLLQGKVTEAISLLRACRDLWPDDEIFSCEDEALSMKTIFFDRYPGGEAPGPSDVTADGLDVGVQGTEKVAEQDADFELDEADNDDQNHVDNDIRSSIREVSLQADDIIQRYANPLFVQWYVWLLKDFDKNTARLNHCLVRMLRRIAFELRLAPMLYQAGLFRILQRCGAGRQSRSFRERHKELVAFGEQLLTSFFELLPRSPKLPAEILFWKSAREAFELEHGYGSFNRSDGTMLLRTEVFDARIRQLYSEFSGNPSRPLESLIGFLEERLQGECSRKKIIRALKRCDIPFMLPLSDRVKARGHWTADEEDQLRCLYEKFKDQRDCCKSIATAMSTGRSKGQVKRKLKELGLPLRTKSRRLAKAQSEDIGVYEQPELFSTDIFENDVCCSEESRDSMSSSTEEEDDLLPSIGLPALVGSLKEAGFTEAIDWLTRVIMEVVEENKSFEIGEAVPIVPTDDIHFKAMRRLQHKYWRIPSTFSVLQLKGCIERLKEACALGKGSPTEEPLEAVASHPAIQVELSASPDAKRFKGECDRSSNEEDIDGSKVRGSDSEFVDDELMANTSFHNFVCDDDE